MKITLEISHEGRNDAKNTDLWSVYATSDDGLETALEMIDTETLNALTIGELRKWMAED